MNSTEDSIEQFEHDLHDVAIAACNSGDFGDPGYRKPLRLLLESFDVGRQLAGGTRPKIENLLVGVLISRLYSERGWRHSPEALQQQVPTPLFVVGLPRSGTTTLHRLLGVDPQFQGLAQWLTATPMIRPPRSTWEGIPEFEFRRWTLDTRYRMSPGLASAHTSSAEELEECCTLLSQDFVSERLAQLAPIDTYMNWLEHADFRNSYLRYANNLRLIGFAEPHTRWLLKDPFHTFHLDLVLDVFPDACVVFLHRDPATVIASTCSLMTMLGGPPGVVDDPRALGARTCAFWERALRRGLAARDLHPKRVYDLHYAAFVRDAIACVREIYRYFGLDLQNPVEQKMRGWLAENRQGKHGQHRYKVTDYGLTEGVIRERFAEYVARYSL